MALHGTSKAYICKRLEQEGETALLAAVRDGRITALTAAVELGWVQRPSLMGGSVNRAKKRQHQLQAIAGELSPGAKMELWLGPNPSGSYFSSREELVQAWETHQDEIMARWGRGGRRPAGFYEFVWDGPRPPYDQERSTLWRAGVLSVDEKVALEREWKVDFEKAHRPDFFHHTGREVLHGDAAVQAHLRWADVPRELVKRWTAALQRRGRVRHRAPAPSEEAAAK